MSLNEAAFLKAWGRAPSPLSVERLQRLQDAFGVGENDGLVTIAMVLEFYDQLYRQYPDECAEAARHAINDGLSSASSLCIDAVTRAIDDGLASLGPRCAAAAKRAVKEELGAARMLPAIGRTPQPGTPARWGQRVLLLWLGYSAFLGAVCWYTGSPALSWTALSTATAGFAVCLAVTRSAGS
jgi:hypothetical protein